MVSVSPISRTRSHSLKSAGNYGRGTSAYHGLCTSSESRNLKDDEDWGRLPKTKSTSDENHGAELRRQLATAKCHDSSLNSTKCRLMQIRDFECDVDVIVSTGYLKSFRKILVFCNSRDLVNGTLFRIQGAVLGLFHKKKLRENQLFELRLNIRNLLGSNVGPFLFEFYTKQAVTQGMHILRERLTSLTGTTLLNSLDDTWGHFYSEIIPTLQAIFFPIKTKQINIRQTILVSYRDVVLLKIPIKQALEEADGTCPPGIKQMLLILQNVHDTFPPNASRLALEKLVALVVTPYLGFQGLYHGLPEPVIWSKESVLLGKKSKKYRPLQRKFNVKSFSPIQESYSLEDMFHSAYARNEEES